MDFNSFLDASNYSQNTKSQYLIYYNLLRNLELNQQTIDILCLKRNNNVFRSFLKLYLYEFLKRNDIEIPKVRGRTKERLPKWLNGDKLSLLYDNADDEMKLVILLGFESGLRVSEILSLTPENITTSTIIGKGNKQAHIFIDDKTRNMLEYYINKYSILPNQMIFSYTSRKAINAKLAKLSLSILGKKVSPHQLRHSCGMYLRRVLHMDMPQIQKFLRHESIITTAIYSSAADEEVEKEWRMKKYEIKRTSETSTDKEEQKEARTS